MNLKNNIHLKQPPDNEAVHESNSNVAVLTSAASNQAQMLLKRSKSQTSETATLQQPSSTNVATTNDSVYQQQAALMFDRSTAHITDVQSFVERTYVANAQSPTNPHVVVGGIPIGEGPLSTVVIITLGMHVRPILNVIKHCLPDIVFLANLQKLDISSGLTTQGVL
eukprot:scaffold49670_cov71-Cyclotella_meneghiniana.AAC.1